MHIRNLQNIKKTIKELLHDSAIVESKTKNKITKITIFVGKNKRLVILFIKKVVIS